MKLFAKELDEIHAAVASSTVRMSYILLEVRHARRFGRNGSQRTLISRC